jgi:hypothetical protein
LQDFLEGAVLLLLLSGAIYLSSKETGVSISHFYGSETA